MITKRIGQLIKDLRKKQGLTQKELGDRLGVSESAVTRYEGGTQNLTILTLQKMANAMNVDLSITITPEQ